MTILVFLALDKKAESNQQRPVGVVITRAEVYDRCLVKPAFRSTYKAVDHNIIEVSLSDW